MPSTRHATARTVKATHLATSEPAHIDTASVAALRALIEDLQIDLQKVHTLAGVISDLYTEDDSSTIADCQIDLLMIAHGKTARLLQAVLSLDGDATAWAAEAKGRTTPTCRSVR